MRPYQFIIFFSVVLTIYGFTNYYIYNRAMMALPVSSTIRGWFPWIFLFLSSSYIFARFLERIWLSPLSEALTWIGSFWLALMVYSLIAVVLIDLIRLIHYWIPIYPEFITRDIGTSKLVLINVVASLVGITVLTGYFNAITPVIKTLEIHIPKKAGDRKDLHIVMASDIHMGTLIGPRRTAKMVEKINSLKPDIILFAGDLVDEDLAPVIRYDLGKSLIQLKAPLGVYGITGNHEYIGGADKAVEYLIEHGISMVRDTSMLIDQSFYIAGRDDRDKSRFSGKPRKSIASVLSGTDMSKPVILLDHQPFRLEEADGAGVDLQLSGHTHHGQLWPFNYLTNAIYELSWGYLRKNNTHYYVSCGYGGWGPSVRLGSRPEIVSIHLTFD